MKYAWILLSLFVSVSSFAVDEYQTVNSQADAKFISSLGLYKIGSVLPKRFNLLIIGQDNSNSKKSTGGRASLGSRADVIMVLSLDTARGASTILSIYRGNSPDDGCSAKLGHGPSSDMINGVYSIGGRQEFIPCLEGMLEKRLHMNPQFFDLLDENGEFPIHAFWEGTRTYTVGPVAKDSLRTVLNNKVAFTSTFGFSAIGAALDVLWHGKDIQSVLNSEEPVQVSDKNVDSHYLIVELKEREAYKAAGYQRAFNFASVIATILGWSAYGIEQYKNEHYEFLGRFFGDVINKNFSSSHDFKVLEKDVFMRSGGHLLGAACFNQNVCPIRIIQWGEQAASYSVYENGKFRVHGPAGLLNYLKVVPILPNPPSCH